MEAMLKYAMFDVDSLELSEDGKSLDFRPRVKPIKAKLQELYSFGRHNGMPLLFSTCCSGRMIQKGTDDILYIPLEGGEEEWLDAVTDYRMIYVAKKTFGVPEINSEKCAYSSFAYNKNLTKVIKELNVDNWIVFGNGFDACTNSTLRGLIEIGENVTLLEDVIVRGSFKYLTRNPEEHKQILLEELKALGVNIISSETFYNSFFRKEEQLSA